MDKLVDLGTTIARIYAHGHSIDFLQSGLSENGVYYPPSEVRVFGENGIRRLQRAINDAYPSGEECCEEPSPTPAGTNEKITASEALYGFTAWLTCRRVAVTLGAAHDAAIAADLVNQWCAANGLQHPRKGVYPNNIAQPATDPDICVEDHALQP